MTILDIIPGTTKWLFLAAVLAFYAIGWVAWRVQNDCIGRGYGPVATTFWSVGTLFCFFPVFPLYLLLREKLGVKAGASETDDITSSALSVLCGTCGTENPAVLSECQQCGQLLVPEATVQGIGSLSCLICGASNPIGAQECGTCGQIL